MASGYEIIGQPTGVVNGLNNLANTITKRKDRQEDKDLRQQQLDARNEQQAKKDLYKGVGDIQNDYSFSKYSTGDVSLDKVLAPQLDQIKTKALEMMKAGGVQEGQMYAAMATQDLGTVHTLATNSLKRANDQVAMLLKQDPNLDAAKLRADVSKQISSNFLNPDGTIVGKDKLNSINISDDLPSQLAASGKYYSSSAPATEFFASKKNMTPFESANHNGLGGGDTIKGASSIYKPITKDANGNYVPTTVSEDIDLGQGRTAKVFPSDQYESLPANVKGAITYSYNQQASDPKSPLYTNQDSPLYGLTPTDSPHPMTEDFGKRWITRNIVDQVSPSYVNRAHTDNRQSVARSGGSGGSGRGSSGSGGGEGYYDAFEDVKTAVPDYGKKVPLNNFGSEVQKYLGSVLTSSGSGLANADASIVKNPDSGRYELVSNEDGTLIAPIDEREMNLAVNPKAAKVRNAIMSTPKEKNKPKERLSDSQVKEGLKHLGPGRFQSEPEKVDLSKFKKDKDGRIDLTSLYD